MTTQHTTGPWIATVSDWPGNPSIDIYGPGREVIARVVYENGRSARAANAALIASAPQLAASNAQLRAALQAMVAASVAIEEAKSTASDDALTCLEGRLESAINQALAALAAQGGDK